MTTWRQVSGGREEKKGSAGVQEESLTKLNKRVACTSREDSGAVVPKTMPLEGEGSGRIGAFWFS